MILNRSNFTKYYTINLATYITLYNTYSFSIYLGVILHKLKGWWHGGMRRDCIYFMTRLYETGLHPIFLPRWYETGLHSFSWQDGMGQDCIRFLWQDSIRPVLIHFYDKPAKYRYSSIFMTSQHKTGTHPCLWQAIIRPVLIHFHDKVA